MPQASPAPSRSASRGSSRRGMGGGGTGVLNASAVGDAPNFRQWAWSVADDVIALRQEFNAFRASLQAGDMQQSAIGVSSSSLAPVSAEALVPAGAAKAQETAIFELKDEHRTFRCAVEAECALLRREVETLRSAQSHLPGLEQDEVRSLRCAVETECAALRHAAKMLQSAHQQFIASDALQWAPEAAAHAANAEGDLHPHGSAGGFSSIGCNIAAEAPSISNLVARVGAVEEAVLDLGRELVCLAEQHRSFDGFHKKLQEQHGDFWESLERMATEAAKRFELVEQAQAHISDGFAMVQEACSKRERLERSLFDDYSNIVKDMDARINTLAREVASQRHHFDELVANLKRDAVQEQIAVGDPLASGAGVEFARAPSQTAAWATHDVPGTGADAMSQDVLRAIDSALQANPRRQPSEAMRMWRAFAFWRAALAAVGSPANRSRCGEQARTSGDVLSLVGSRSDFSTFLRAEFEQRMEQAERRLLAEVQHEVSRQTGYLQHCVRSEFANVAAKRAHKAETAGFVAMSHAELTAVSSSVDDSLRACSMEKSGGVEAHANQQPSAHDHEESTISQHLKEELVQLRQDFRHDRSSWQFAFEACQQQARLESAQLGQQVENVEQAIKEQRQRLGSSMQHDLSEHHEQLLGAVEAVLEQRHGGVHDAPSAIQSLQQRVADQRVEWSEALGELRGCVRSEWSMLLHEMRAEIGQSVQSMSCMPQRQFQSSVGSAGNDAKNESANTDKTQLLDEASELALSHSIATREQMRLEFLSVSEFSDELRSICALEATRGREHAEVQESTRQELANLEHHCNELAERVLRLREEQASESALQHSIETRQLTHLEFSSLSELGEQLRSSWTEEETRGRNHGELLESTSQGLVEWEQKCNELAECMQSVRDGQADVAAVLFHGQTHEAVRNEFGSLSEVVEQLQTESDELGAWKSFHAEQAEYSNRQLHAVTDDFLELSRSVTLLQDNHLEHQRHVRDGFQRQEAASEETCEDLQTLRLEVEEVRCTCEAACNQSEQLAGSASTVEANAVLAEEVRQLQEALRQLEHHHSTQFSALDVGFKRAGGFEALWENVNSLHGELATLAGMRIELQQAKSDFEMLRSAGGLRTLPLSGTVMSRRPVDEVFQGSALAEPATGPGSELGLRQRRCQAPRQEHEYTTACAAEYWPQAAVAFADPYPEPPPALDGFLRPRREAHEAAAMVQEELLGLQASLARSRGAQQMVAAATGLHDPLNSSDARRDGGDTAGSTREFADRHSNVQGTHAGQGSSTVPRVPGGGSSSGGLCAEPPPFQAAAAPTDVGTLRPSCAVLDEAGRARSSNRPRRGGRSGRTSSSTHNSASSSRSSRNSRSSQLAQLLGTGSPLQSPRRASPCHTNETALRQEPAVPYDPADTSREEEEEGDASGKSCSSSSSGLMQLLEPSAPAALSQLEGRGAAVNHAQKQSDLPRRCSSDIAAKESDVHEALVLHFPEAPWPAPADFEHELRSLLRSCGVQRIECISMSLWEGLVVEIFGQREILKELDGPRLRDVAVLGFPVGFFLKTQVSAHAHDEHQRVRLQDLDISMIVELLAQHGKVAKDVRRVCGEVHMQRQKSMRMESELEGLLRSQSDTVSKTELEAHFDTRFQEFQSGHISVECTAREAAESQAQHFRAFVEEQRQEQEQLQQQQQQQQQRPELTEHVGAQVDEISRDGFKACADDECREVADRPVMETQEMSAASAASRQLGRRAADIQFARKPWDLPPRCAFDHAEQASELQEVLMLHFPEAPWPPPSDFENAVRAVLRSLGAERAGCISVSLREGLVVEIRGQDDILSEIQDLRLRGVEVLGCPIGLVWKTLVSVRPSAEDRGARVEYVELAMIEDLLAQYGRLTKDIRCMYAKVHSQHQTSMHIESELEALLGSQCDATLKTEVEAYFESQFQDLQRHLESTAREVRESAAEQFQQLVLQQQRHEPMEDASVQVDGILGGFIDDSGTCTVDGYREFADDSILDTKELSSSAGVYLDQGVLEEWRAGVAELRGALCRAWAAEDSRNANITARSHDIDSAIYPALRSEIGALAEAHRKHVCETCALKEALAGAVHEGRLGRNIKLDSEELAQRLEDVKVSEVQEQMSEEFESVRMFLSDRVDEHAECLAAELSVVQDHLTNAMDDGVALRRQVLALCEAKGAASQVASVPLVALRSRIEWTEDCLAELRGQVADAVEGSTRVQGDLARMEARIDAGDQNSARGLGSLQRAVEALQAEVCTLRRPEAVGPAEEDSIATHLRCSSSCRSTRGCLSPVKARDSSFQVAFDGL